MIKTFFFFLISVFIISPAFAQALKLNCTQMINTEKNLNKSNSLDNAYLFTQQNLLSCNSLSSVDKGVHYTALFCRLENTLHKQLNVWVKLRAGNDDEYRKFCGQW